MAHQAGFWDVGERLKAISAKALARREFERVYAEDPEFADVAQRLGCSSTDSQSRRIMQRIRRG